MNPEAIEAAAKRLWYHGANTGTWHWGQISDETRQRYRDEARAALEAAAPYLIREARAAELEAAADGLDLPGSSATGYYSSNNDSGYREAEAHAETWLRARSAAIRAGEA